MHKANLLLNASLESPQDMIILSIDREYNYLYFNSYHKNVMLVAYGTEVERGMNLLSCMTNGDDVRKARINYDRALAGEAHTTTEEYGDQERSWFETRYNPILDEDGRVIGATAFSLNVTARIQAENRYRFLFENNHAPMLLIDTADGSIGEVNQAACDFYGWPRDNLLTMNISQINTLSPDEIRDEMARAVAEKRKSFHFCHRKSDGSVVDVDVHTGVIELEGKAWLLTIVYDISEKIAALKQKDDFARRLSHYLATSPTITYSLRFHDGHDNWQWVSENASSILGYTQEEILQPDWWFDNLHPIDRPRVLSSMAKLSGDSSISLEYRFLRKNRTFLWLRDEKRWTTSISGDLEIVGSLTDISECKAIEAELILKSSALEATANPVIITDGGGSIEWVNKAFERFTGYSLDEALGKNPKELLNSGAQSVEFYRKMWSVILSGNTWREQIVNHKKNGDIFTAEMTITPIPDQTGHLSHFIAETNDITERLRVEKELRKFEMLLKYSLESPKDMIILSIDTEYRYLCFNTCHKSTMLRAYGMNVEPGMNLLECITDDDDRIRSKQNFDRALAGEYYITREEYGDLERVFYETRYNPILDDKNRIIGATAFSFMKERNI